MTTAKVYGARLVKAVFIFFPLFMSSSLASADSWRAPVTDGLVFQDEGRSKKSIALTPFDNEPAAQLFSREDGLSLAPLTIDDFMLKVFKSNDLNSGLEIRSSIVKPQFKLTNAVSSSQTEYLFYFNNIRLCGYQVKASIDGQSSPLVFGEMPVIDDEISVDVAAWPTVEEAKARLSYVIAGRYGLLETAVLEQERCYHVAERALRPVWRLVLSAGDMSYEGLADADEAYQLFPRAFDVDGSARVFKNNLLDGRTESFVLKGLVGNSMLENPYFKTAIYSSSNQLPAKSANHVFDFQPGTSQFAETSLFTNANRILDWLVQYGYDISSFKQMKIWVHAVVSGSINNALYDTQSGSQFFIGDGDGKVLQNLATDSDVISHEFGHHVIYPSIKNISSFNSLVAHEGLADFLTYIRTGNACLGESICPVGSRLCATPKCLRTAENDYKWGGPGLPMDQAHLTSQFLSGMLWDLKVKDGIADDVLAKIVLKSIDYMPTTIEWQYFIAALMRADQIVTGGANCQDIYNRAGERGLYESISSFGCGQNVGLYSEAVLRKYPSISQNFPSDVISEAQQNTTPTNPGATTTRISKSSPNTCGSLIGNHRDGVLPLIILWMLPVAVIGLKRRIFQLKQ
jgi:hypothetical protein